MEVLKKMDKKELVEFLKENLKIRVYSEELYGGRTQIEVCLNLDIDGKEVEIDSDSILID